MKKTLTGLLGTIVISAIALMSVTIQAQNFTNNTGGTYTANCNAVVRMKSDVGAFDGTAQLGATAPERIEGTVDWNSTDPNQTVQGLYYTNLVVTGGTKTMADGIFVGGDGCPTPLAGYASLTGGVGYYAAAGTGNRTYNGTFTYDGATDQIIFAESGGAGSANIYNNLTLENAGQKSVLTTETVAIAGIFDLDATNTGGLLVNGTLNGGTDITQDAAAPIVVDAGTFNTGSGNNTFAGQIDIDNAGEWYNSAATLNSYAGTVNVNDGSFNIDVDNTNTTIALGGTLDLTAVAGVINMGAASDLDIVGAFVNSVAAGGRTNMNFDATSTVTYSGAGAQGLVAADATNKYGNLVFSNTGIKTADGDNYVQTTSTVNISGGYIDMDGNVFDVDVTGGNSISYASANNDEYILGSVRLSGTMDEAVTYTMNNAQTQVSFLAASVPTDFTLDVQPNTAPTETNNFDNTTDVNRKVNIDWTGTGSLDLLRVGYTNGDLGAFTGNEDDLRFVEGYDSNQDYQKITGGSGIATNSGAADPRFVDLASTGGIDLVDPAPGTTQEIGRGSDIILTSTPLVYIAVNNGRWTNPGTWDEGAYPPASGVSNVQIDAVVYVGIDGPAYGTPALNNTTEENSIYPGPATNSIEILAGADKALIIGNEDNGDGYVFYTETDPGASLQGLASGLVNTSAGVNSGDWNTKTTDPSGNDVYGLFMTDNTAYPQPAIFGTSTITNTGNIVNNAIIEIAE